MVRIEFSVIWKLFLQCSSKFHITDVMQHATSSLAHLLKHEFMSQILFCLIHMVCKGSERVHFFKSLQEADSNCQGQVLRSPPPEHRRQICMLIHSSGETLGPSFSVSSLTMIPFQFADRTEDFSGLFWIMCSLWKTRIYISPLFRRDV